MRTVVTSLIKTLLIVADKYEIFNIGRGAFVSPSTQLYALSELLYYLIKV